MESTANLIARNDSPPDSIGDPTIDESMKSVIAQRLRRFHEARKAGKWRQPANVEVAANCCAVYLLCKKHVSRLRDFEQEYGYPGVDLELAKSELTLKQARKSARKILIAIGYLPKLSFAGSFDIAMAALTRPL